MFRVNKAGATRGEGMTQFGRALHDLNIESICANSAPAKGRVERANSTLQDRLVKDLRLAKVSSIIDGNNFLESFRGDYNARFGRIPASDHDAHRKLITPGPQTNAVAGQHVTVFDYPDGRFKIRYEGVRPIEPNSPSRYRQQQTFGFRAHDGTRGSTREQRAPQQELSLAAVSDCQ